MVETTEHVRPSLADDGRRRTNVFRMLLVGGCAAIAGIAIVCFAAWSTNGAPGERHIWPAVGADLVVTLVFLVVGWRFVDRLSVFAASLASMAVIGVWLGVFVVPSWAVAQAVRDAQPALDARINQLAAGGSRCFQPAGADRMVGPLTNVATICVAVDKGQIKVTFTSGADDHYRGLIYFPAARNAQQAFSDVCVHHVYGPWWEEVAYTTASLTCPVGFTGVGGG